MTWSVFATIVHLGVTFTEGAGLYNGGLWFEKDGGIVWLVYMQFCQQGPELDAELFIRL